MVRKSLAGIKRKYPHIKWFVTLAYITGGINYENSIYPEGLESVPPKYAISKRNIWMIDKSDYVVVYVKYSLGGAAQFKGLAEKRGKIIINLAENKKRQISEEIRL